MYLLFPIKKMQALFNRDANIFRWPSALPCPCALWLAGLIQLRPQLPFAEDFGRRRHPPKENQGTLFDSTHHGNVRVDSADILLNTEGSKQKAESQPSHSPGEKVPRCR